MDLARQANRKGIVCFSDFLNLSELHKVHSVAGQLEGTYRCFGGYEGAERQMVAWIPDAFSYAWQYPISCIQIEPLHPKYAENLSHRDVLGALMNLGIRREKLGDIFAGENGYYFFCKHELADYLTEQLCQIRHTEVRCRLISAEETEWLQLKPSFVEFEKVITSNRLDNLISALTGLSRSKASAMIASGKVFINGEICSYNTYEAKEGDVISVRGFGKFFFLGISGETRKERLKMSFRKYV